MKSHFLLGSPRELEERKESTNPGNLDFLLINIGGACNHNCFFCWTHNNTYPIKNKEFLNDSELELLVKAFYESGGDTCAIMSDGEPLFSVNFKITKKLTEITNKFNMNMLIFSNGQLLDNQMIDELTKINSKTSFVVSVNASNPRIYDKIHGVKGAFEKIMENTKIWKEFCKKTNQKINENKTLTQFAIHFVANKTNLAEIPKMQKLANEIDCALIITAPGMSGRALLYEDEIAKSREDLKFLEEITEKYSDTQGPTAKTYSNECAYISSSYNKNFHGITIHSLGGMVLPCPYFVGLGSEEWFELKKYLKSGGKDIQKWLGTSVKIATMITDKIFETFEHHYCLKRHPRYPEIENFMFKLNTQMKSETFHLNINSENYFDKIIELLEEELIKN